MHTSFCSPGTPLQRECPCQCSATRCHLCWRVNGMLIIRNVFQDAFFAVARRYRAGDFSTVSAPNCSPSRKLFNRRRAFLLNFNAEVAGDSVKTLLHLLTAILTTVQLTTCPRSRATRRTLSGSNQQLKLLDVETGTTQPFREWKRPPKKHFTLPGPSRRSRRWVVEATNSWQPGRNRRCNEGTMWSQWRLRGSENVHSDVSPQQLVSLPGP